MKNKILTVLLATVLILSLTSCGTGDVGDENYMQSKAEQEANIKQNEEDQQGREEPVKNPSLASMCEYLEYYGYISSEQKSSVAYEMIGAKDGVRYKDTTGNFYIEIYEYDINNLNEHAITVRDSVISNGSFVISNINIPGELSDNGKYLMSYTDVSSEESNLQHKEKIENIFKTWP